MLRKWLGIVGVSGLSIAAPLSGGGAADLQLKAARLRPAPPPAWSWSGFYVGINGGYGWNNQSGDSSCTGAAGCELLPSPALSPEGGLFGGQVGYNVQNGNIVYGLETDIQGADIKDSITLVAPFVQALGAVGGVAGPVNFNTSQRLNWFGTARARLGWATSDRTLLYATGGLIYGRESVSLALTSGAATYAASDASVRVGGTFGGGLEYAFAQNLSGKIEGLYYDMGGETISSLNPVTGLTRSGLFTYRGVIVRGGLNYALGDQFAAPIIPLGLLAPASPRVSGKAMLVKASPLPPPSVWTGYYIGGNLGADWGKSDVVPQTGGVFPPFTNLAGNLVTPAQFATLPGATGSGSSVIGGGQAGYNWQTGSFVYGLEGDIDGTGLHESSSSPLSRTTISGTQTVTANFSANVDWIATLRGKVGYAQDRYMLYGTVGMAVAGTSLNTTNTITQAAPAPTPGSGSQSRDIAGWTAGVGGEWAIDRAWSVGLEYRHTDFSTHSYTIGYTDVSLAPFIAPETATVHFRTDQVTSRLNWHPWN